MGCLLIKFFVLFTALHGMRTRSSDENSVRLSVCLSVCHTHAYSAARVIFGGDRREHVFVTPFLRDRYTGCGRETA